MFSFYLHQHWALASLVILSNVLIAPFLVTQYPFYIHFFHSEAPLPAYICQSFHNNKCLSNNKNKFEESFY